MVQWNCQSEKILELRAGWEQHHQTKQGLKHQRSAGTATFTLRQKALNEHAVRTHAHVAALSQGCSSAASQMSGCHAIGSRRIACSALPSSHIALHHFVTPATNQSKATFDVASCTTKLAGALSSRQVGERPRQDRVRPAGIITTQKSSRCAMQSSIETMIRFPAQAASGARRAAAEEALTAVQGDEDQVQGKRRDAGSHAQCDADRQQHSCAQHTVDPRSAHARAEERLEVPAVVYLIDQDVVDEAVGVGEGARLLPDPQRVAEADGADQDTEQVDGPLSDRVVERVPPRAPPHARESVRGRRTRAGRGRPFWCASTCAVTGSTAPHAPPRCDKA